MMFCLMIYTWDSLSDDLPKGTTADMLDKACRALRFCKWRRVAWILHR